MKANTELDADTSEVRVNILVPPEVRKEWKLFAAAVDSSVKDLLIAGMEHMMEEHGWRKLRADLARRQRK